MLAGPSAPPPSSLAERTLVTRIRDPPRGALSTSQSHGLFAFPPKKVESTQLVRLASPIWIPVHCLLGPSPGQQGPSKPSEPSVLFCLAFTTLLCPLWLWSFAFPPPQRNSKNLADHLPVRDIRRAGCNTFASCFKLHFVPCPFFFFS